MKSELTEPRKTGGWENENSDISLFLGLGGRLDLLLSSWNLNKVKVEMFKGKRAQSNKIKGEEDDVTKYWEI